jgi:hypothetical protein
MEDRQGQRRDLNAALGKLEESGREDSDEKSNYQKFVDRAGRYQRKVPGEFHHASRFGKTADTPHVVESEEKPTSVHE